MSWLCRITVDVVAVTTGHAIWPRLLSSQELDNLWARTWQDLLRASARLATEQPVRFDCREQTYTPEETGTGS
jgi:hypothetical protein